MGVASLVGGVASLVGGVASLVGGVASLVGGVASLSVISLYRRMPSSTSDSRSTAK